MDIGCPGNLILCHISIFALFSVSQLVSHRGAVVAGQQHLMLSVQSYMTLFQYVVTVTC